VLQVESGGKSAVMMRDILGSAIEMGRPTGIHLIEMADADSEGEWE